LLNMHGVRFDCLVIVYRVMYRVCVVEY